MKLYIDTLRALIPSVSIGSDHSVHLVLHTVDWQQHHSLVMSPDEARHIAANLLCAADECEKAVSELRTAIDQQLAAMQGGIQEDQP